MRRPPVAGVIRDEGVSAIMYPDKRSGGAERLRTFAHGENEDGPKPCRARVAVVRRMTEGVPA
jgi:hypothetical protein